MRDERRTRSLLSCHSSLITSQEGLTMRQSRPSVWVVLVVLVVALAIAGLRGCTTSPVAPTTSAGKPGEYLFCFWNVENLFDDREGGYSHEPDKGYDTWFYNNPETLREKYSHLSEALMALNGGRGPDILAA